MLHVITGTGLTFRRNKQKNKDKRDYLPFDIYSDFDHKSLLGSYLLDSTTACGDYVDLGKQGVYSVKRVIFVYRYEHGALTVFKKKLHLIPQVDKSSSKTFWADDNEGALSILQ